ncbi:hypothetical protein ACL7TT_07370 [Microbulbifer sp. 2304DJ12-6]|uniref:hypothetical protein n=1 Tax=Microbulbifer sp. 2304DJ12-6 TaxID=3233340 RepID=UPI0039B01538
MKFISGILVLWLCFFSSESFSNVYEYTKIFSDKSLFSLDVTNGEINISDVSMKAKYGSDNGWCEISSDYFSFFAPRSIPGKKWEFSGFDFNVTGSGVLKFLGTDTPYIRIDSEQDGKNVNFYFSYELGLLGVSLNGDFNTLALCSSSSCKW